MNAKDIVVSRGRKLSGRLYDRGRFRLPFSEITRAKGGFLAEVEIILIQTTSKKLFPPEQVKQRESEKKICSKIESTPKKMEGGTQNEHITRLKCSQLSPVHRTSALKLPTSPLIKQYYKQHYNFSSITDTIFEEKPPPTPGPSSNSPIEPSSLTKFKKHQVPWQLKQQRVPYPLQWQQQPLWLRRVWT